MIGKAEYCMATILIVDDSPEVRVALTATLKDAGHTVQEASDGRDAVEQATLIQPDAIILDINMPDIDGITALRGLRADPITRDTYPWSCSLRSQTWTMSRRPSRQGRRIMS